MATSELPTYKHWDDVPAGLHTKTQLGNITPRRKLAKDAEPAARVRYMGNKYTYLYPLAASVEKPEATEAQQRSIAAASASRWVCKRCDHRADPAGAPLTGRLCNRCHGGSQDHADHIAWRKRAAAELERLGTRGVVIHATGMDLHGGVPSRVAAVAIADETVLTDIGLPARLGPRAYRPALDQLHEVLTERGAWLPSRVDGRERDPDYAHRFLVGWSFETSVGPCLQLPNPGADGVDVWRNRAGYPWLSAWARVSDLWCGYWRERPPGAALDGPMSHIRYDLPLPDATGDAVEDARLIGRLLKAMATGEAPTSPTAFWRHPKHGVEQQ